MAFMTLALAAALTIASIGSAAGQDATMRFAGMDRDHDGRVTRAEWRGNLLSFSRHDWNGDGVLAGEEVRPGGQREVRGTTGDLGASNSFDDWTARGFRYLDRNRDGAISVDEWQFDRRPFRLADDNSDGTLSRSEFLDERDRNDRRSDRFDALDADGDGRIDRAEWRGSSARYAALDDDRDGTLAAAEFVRPDKRGDLFTRLDVDGNGSIARSEWTWTLGSFDRSDVNRDGVLSRVELEDSGSSSGGVDARAYRAGSARGRADGLLAGRGDRANDWGWDLEGQRELESADAGYTATAGSHGDYQAGYRNAFRLAYAEGFNQQGARAATNR